MAMIDTRALRDHLVRVLDWEDAHVGFDKAIDGIPAGKHGARAPGFEHSPWQPTKAAARLTVVVVLPLPPLLFDIVILRISAVALDAPDETVEEVVRHGRHAGWRPEQIQGRTTDVVLIPVR